MKDTMLSAAIALSAICLAFSAQAASDAPPKPLPPQQKNGKPISSDLDVSLKIDGALHASGYSGCNSWSAVIYPVKDQHLAMGPPALTKKQCDKDTMAIEFDFLSVLHSGPTWDLVNGELVIKGPRGTLRLARSL